MKDLEFKANIGDTFSMSRSQLRRWKREYFKKARVESAGHFYRRVSGFLAKTSSGASSTTGGRLEDR